VFGAIFGITAHTHQLVMERQDVIIQNLSQSTKQPFLSHDESLHQSHWASPATYMLELSASVSLVWHVCWVVISLSLI
jgi:hypothetical protein